MTSTAITNVVDTVCRNQECWWEGRVRSVGMVHLGQGVYQAPGYVCECGMGLTILRRTEDIPLPAKDPAHA